MSQKQKRGPAGSSPKAGRSILERWSALKTDLKPTGQKVVDYILFQPEAVLHMSVTELAKATGTSPTSVVRICQSIGANGFRDLKLALARDLVEPTTPIGIAGGFFSLEILSESRLSISSLRIFRTGGRFTRLIW